MGKGVPEGKRNTERVFSGQMKPDEVKLMTDVPSKEWAGGW